MQTETAKASGAENAPAAKTGAAKQEKKSNTKAVGNRTVRVDIEKLDSLMNLVSELIIAKNSLVSISASGSSDASSSSAFNEIENGGTYSAPPSDSSLGKSSYWRK